MKKYFRTFGVFCSIGIITMSTVFLAGCGTEKSEEKQATKVTTEKNAEEIISEEVKNNGSYLLTVGDVLYFRDYPISSMEITNIGKGHMGKVSDGKKSYICSYDKKTGEVEKVTEDEYGGKLYYSADAIYTSNENSETPKYAKISLEDGLVKDLGEGTIEGISEDGTLLAVEKADDNENKITVVRTTDQSEVVTIEKTNTMVNYIGFYENSVVYEWDETVLYNAEIDEQVSKFSDYYSVHHICQQDLDSKEESSLGTITLPYMEESEENNVSVENGNATVKGFRDISFCDGVISGNRVGVSFQVAEGTGAIFSSGYVTSATLGQEDSLDWAEYIQSTPDDESLVKELEKKGIAFYEEMPQIWFDEDGTLVYGEHRWNSAYLTEDVLVYLDENGEETQVTSAYARENCSDAEASKETAFDYSEIFLVDGGKIYSVRENIQRESNADEGWREAYQLNKLEYCEITIANGTVNVFQVEE